MDKNKITEIYDEIVSNGLIHSGVINPSDKSDDELKNEIEKFAKDAASGKKKVKFEVVVDYTRDILNEARTYVKQEEYHFACLMYATYFEHWINGIIQLACFNKKLSEKDTSQIIRDLPLRSKVSWLFNLLEIKSIPPKHLKKIFEITDLRNAFVHYKWKSDKENLKKDPEKEVLNDIENTIKYIINYELKYIYKNKKSKVKKHLKSIQS